MSHHCCVLDHALVEAYSHTIYSATFLNHDTIQPRAVTWHAIRWSATFSLATNAMSSRTTLWMRCLCFVHFFLFSRLRREQNGCHISGKPSNVLSWKNTVILDSSTQIVFISVTEGSYSSCGRHDWRAVFMSRPCGWETASVTRL